MQLVQLGLEGADLAPGSEATLHALRNPAIRPNRPREPVPPVPPHRPFELDEGLFGKSLRSAKRGASGGPSGMTWKHLRPLLERSRDTHLLFRAGELLGGDGEHHPIGSVDCFAETIWGFARHRGRRGSPSFGGKDHGATVGSSSGDFHSPFQFALTTRSGCECVAHTIQALCQADPQLTLTSLDGVSAFDLISRRAMLEKIFQFAPIWNQGVSQKGSALSSTQRIPTTDQTSQRPKT